MQEGLNYENIGRFVENCRNEKLRLGERNAEVQRNICRILAYQKDCQRYKYDEGYDSLAEYAEKELGIKKAQAYQYVRVYEKFFASNREILQKMAEEFPISNLAELVNISDWMLQFAYEKELIYPSMTQKELRERAKIFKESQEKYPEINDR